MSDKIKFWCHKILPLVYDDSLSYYEVLCKMKATINEVIVILNDMEEKLGSLEDLTREAVEEYLADHPEAIASGVAAYILAHPEIIEAGVLTEITAHPEWIDDAVEDYLAENLSIPFYNVQKYGASPSLPDNYSALHALMKDYVSKTGGIVYFPRGKYTISYTVFVPENTVMCGEGELSEIYFDETDTTIGVGVANAGSNVTITNLKLSHKSAGIFSTGAQPGALGFSDFSKTMATDVANSHTITRANVRNLTAENLVFDGNYAVQVENGSTYQIQYVTLKNLKAPQACVSVAPYAIIDDVLIENVDCDLLRIFDNHKIHNRTGTKNLLCVNTKATTLYVSDYYTKEDYGFTFINFQQKGAAKNNNVIGSSYCCALNANISFINSLLAGRDNETGGIQLFHGRISFDKCVIYMQEKIYTAMVAVTEDDSYALYMDNCEIINRAVNPGTSVLMGYGSNNIIGGHNILSRLWGDMNDYLPMFENVSPSTHPNRLIVNNKELIMRVYTVITGGVIGTYPARMAQFPCDFSCIPCTIWNSSNRLGTALETFLNVDNGSIVIGENGINPTNYDRLMIHATIPVTGTPTVKQMHGLLG